MIQSNLFFLLLASHSVQPFLHTIHYPTIASNHYIEDATRLQCICINCRYVTNCKAYHFVEEKHKQPHICDKPTFVPRDGSPGIEVHIRTKTKNTNKVVDQMNSEMESEEQKAIGNNDVGGDLIGDTIYDMSGSVELEYDVVECEDFVEDKDCWIRNMPEEIRLANPNFVPP